MKPPSAFRAVWMVAPLVFGSGFCALVFQTAWQREFRLVFGASTAASAAVIAVFMGGLGLGGWLIGPRVDRRGNPLRFYAALEAGVGLTALATPTLLQLIRRVYLSLGGTLARGEAGGTVVRLVLAGFVLLVPTFVAGGTLGAVTRAVESESDRSRRSTALLYGLNTLGAVAGCLAATFWLLERFGTRSTIWLAAVANLLVAAVAATMSLARPDMVPVIFEALGQRFAVSALEEARRLVRLSVESHGRTLARCHEALEPFEPPVPWRADVLQYRADCYARTRDPRALEARSDLECYNSQDVKAGGPPQPVPRPRQ